MFGCLVYCFFSVVVDAIVFVVGAHHIMATRYYYVITMKLCGPHWLRPLSSFDVRQRWSIHEKICIVFNVKRSTMRAMRIYSSMVMCQIWYVDFYEQKSGFALLISQLFGFSQFVPWNLLLCAVNIRQHGKYQEVEINTPKSTGLSYVSVLMTCVEKPSRSREIGKNLWNKQHNDFHWTMNCTPFKKKCFLFYRNFPPPSTESALAKHLRFCDLFLDQWNGSELACNIQ